MDKKVSIASGRRYRIVTQGRPADRPAPSPPSPRRRDRSSSASRSVRFRVEIGPGRGRLRLAVAGAVRVLLRRSCGDARPGRRRRHPGGEAATVHRRGRRDPVEVPAGSWRPDHARAGETGSPPHCMGPVSPAWPGRSPAPAPLGCGRAASCGLRPVRAGTSTYLCNTNVPFSHPSEGRAQKDGRKVRSRWEGTFTSSTTVDDRRAPSGAARPVRPVRRASPGVLRPARSARCGPPGALR